MAGLPCMVSSWVARVLWIRAEQGFRVVGRRTEGAGEKEERSGDEHTTGRKEYEWTQRVLVIITSLLPLRPPLWRS